MSSLRLIFQKVSKDGEKKTCGRYASEHTMSRRKARLERGAPGSRPSFGR